MYPNITLKIENYKPSIIYFTNEGTSRELISATEDIRAIIIDLADKLNLLNEAKQSKDEEIIYLLNLAFQGDERLIEKLPELNKDSKTFGLEDFVSKELAKAEENREDYSEYKDVSAEVLNELMRNQNLDIFASLLESIHNIMISKTLAFASSMGIGEILLNDKDNIVRLREKMASELSKLDIELKFEE